MINESEAVPRTPIAILGSGSIAQKAYFPLLTAWEGIEIAAIYSRNAQHAMNACARWNLPYWSTSIDDLFKLNIKAAFVLTSKESHYSLIQTLLEDGVDVFVEKPLTTTSQQALELAELAQKKKRILMVGFNRRYALLYRQAKQKLDGKEIQLIVIQKHRTTPHYPNLTEFYLEDYIHQIDLLRYFCGEVEPLQTSFQMRDQTLHSCISTVLLPNGGLGTLLSAHTAGIWQESVSIHADNLSIHVDAFRNLWVRYAEHEELFGSDRAGNWTPDLRERGFIPEIEHFFHCIETRAEPESNGLEAAKTQQLLEKLLPGS